LHSRKNEINKRIPQNPLLLEIREAEDFYFEQIRISSNFLLNAIPYRDTCKKEEAK